MVKNPKQVLLPRTGKNGVIIKPHRGPNLILRLWYDVLQTLIQVEHRATLHALYVG